MQQMCVTVNIYGTDSNLHVYLREEPKIEVKQRGKGDIVLNDIYRIYNWPIEEAIEGGEGEKEIEREMGVLSSNVFS